MECLSEEGSLGGTRSLMECLSVIPDPRVERAQRHKLLDMLVILVCATLGGADDCRSIELFARTREAWFRERLELPGGIPSHDTFRRLLARIDPEVLQSCLREWLEELRQALGIVPAAPGGNIAECERVVGDQVSRERRYYISSLETGVVEFARATRDHWKIENSLHWVLDIAFREDECRLRKDHSAENLALLRRFAVSLFKQDKTKKVGVKNRRLCCGWDLDYLAHILSLDPPLPAETLCIT